MPKRYGVEEKDLVVAHILELLLAGRLRTGDRVDRNEIARALGLSRAPVQEAVVQLEHDGILAMRYHRGAFVQQFDEAVLREHHEVHGLLTGAVSARAAVDPRPAVLDKLDSAAATACSATAPREYLNGANRFRDILVEEYAGPRLKAGISASRSFMAYDFWVNYPSTPAQLSPLLVTEHAAILRRHPSAARQACIDRSDLMADILIAELSRRGVFADSD